MKARDFTGEKYGLLSVIKMADKRNKYGDILWDCSCDCGGAKLVTSGNLKHGLVISCGCRSGSPTHGDWNKRIRIIWVNMMRRCYIKTDKQFKHYGGRGIKVCKKWHDYEEFKKWAFGNGYTDELTIERLRVNKGYYPSNCTWITKKLQARNRRSSKFLRINGQLKTVAEWSDIYAIPQQRINDRLTLGWTPLKAVSEPVDKKYIRKDFRK